MADNIGSLARIKLRNLCLPGAHDAGMSKRGTGTVGAFDCNVITQYNSILGQLNLGVRYFDIRPVISGGEFYTGHYSNVPVLGWQGANGQSIDSIVNDINTFISTQHELIILNISHDLDTDTGRLYQPFTQQQYNHLCKKLSRINHRACGDYPTFLDLTMGEFIGGNATQSNVVIIADPSNETVVPMPGTCVWNSSKLKMYNNYTGTNDLKEMVHDQLNKMKNHQNEYFLLSWTLTQDATQAATCELPIVGGKSILDLAEEANQALEINLTPACTSTIYPNIIYLDGIKNDEVMKLSLDINLNSKRQS
ncbi:MAG: hypothetical protein QM534_04330 [Sediminibacterium sp.]|nr:hypothetical protein [Sediminibacterium sp.]